MERGSDKHGARVDDALEAEVRGMLQAGRDTRAEEWNSAEPSGEDQPDVDRAPHGTLHGGVPDGMTEEDVEGRSELASYLGKEIWPAAPTTMIEKAREQNAPDRVIDLVERLPQREYANVQDAWSALTGAGEAHRS
jgi:hypothetical protein